MTVEVRDENRKIIEGPSSVNSNMIKETDIKFELVAENYTILEHKMRDLGRTLKAWMPKYHISIGAFLLNEGTKTYSNMASFYGDENRFVIHT